MEFKPRLAAAKIAGLYLVVGLLWILLSDYFLYFLVPDSREITELQNYKGWFFIGITAVTLYVYNARQLKLIKEAQEDLSASEERFRKLTDVSPDAILVEQNGSLVYANSSAAELVGMENASELLGRTLLEFVDPDCRRLLRERQMASAGQRQKVTPLEIRIQQSDDVLVDTLAVWGNITWKGQSATQFILRDVSELKQALDKLRLTSKRLQLAIEGAGECIWDFDIPNDTFTFSGGIEDIRRSTNNYSNVARHIWRGQVHPEDLDRVRQALQEALVGKTPSFESEYRLKADDGSWKWIWARGVVVERDRNGKAIAMTGTLADITMRKSSDELAWRYANLDALSGLPNRRLFHEKLEFELRMAKRTDSRLAILFIDLDGFKRVNDLYGHNAGDLLLMEAAHRLRNCVRETDIVARLGGDEFTVTLTQLSDAQHIEFTCQKILSSLSKPFYIENEVGYVSGSIGISFFPLDGTDSDELIRKADQAMYAAKRAGKNQFHYFTKEMDDRAHGRLRIAEALRHALTERQLSVYYQPVVNLRTGQIEKAEALLRWQHPRLGEIKPSQFVSMAEETGLIKEIGNWAFEQAARFSKSCTERTGAVFQIGINKSPVQFMSRDSGQYWLDYLAEQGIAPKSISIEITEGVLLDASDVVVEKLDRYRHAGMQFALDDFGTGYASMSYLQKFQIDYVKIDQSFVRDMTSNESSRTIAETIIVMAHKLGKKVIAEGVETQEQMASLASAGCDYAQGYLFSPPVPGEALLQMLFAEQPGEARLMH